MSPASLLLLSTAALAGRVFVSPAEAEALRAGGAAIIDARGGGWIGDWGSAWRRGHIPGAAPLDWLKLRDGFLRTGRLAPLDKLTAAARAAGVRDGVPVVVYGAGAQGWGEEGRIFWMLDYLGHPEVYILDGGWPAWIAAGLPVSDRASYPAPGDFTPAPLETRRAVRVEVEAARAGPAVIWDTREAREYAGETPYGEARGGHIPEAVNLWYGELLRPDGTLRPEDELRAALAGAGIPMDRPVITLCTGGVRSGFAYAVLRQLDHPAPSNYAGSMWEWAASDLPLATGE